MREMFLSFFNTIQATEALESTSGNVADQVKSWLGELGLTDTITSILGGLAILIIGFFVCKFISGMIGRLIKRTGIDNKLKGDFSISKFVAKLIYYILMIIVLMAALNIMGVGGDVLAPLNDMVTKFTSAIPNIIVAGIILYAGYFLAKMVSELVSFSGDTIQNFAPKFKLPENIDIVKILKNIIFIFIFVPIAIIALDQLKMRVITEPATDMLGTFMAAIPSILKAAAILFVVIFGGNFVKGLLQELLESLKVNSLAEKLHLQNVLGNTNLSSAIANIALFFIIYFGVIEALNALGLDQIVEIFDGVLAVVGKIVFGLFILAVGSFIANFAVGIYTKGEEHNKFTASILKGAIMVLFLAMGLNAMGIADNIIQLAFGLGLGALAVAFALSFGLGGKEAAGKEMESFLKKFKK